MNAEEKKANRITRTEVIMIVGLVFTICLILLAGFAGRVWASDVTVNRGSLVGTGPLVAEAGVQVHRGFSNYPVYETRESQKPTVQRTEARQFFGEWDNWRHRIARCKVNPNGRGRRSC